MPWIVSLSQKQVGNWLPLEVSFLCDTSYVTSISSYCFLLKSVRLAPPGPQNDPFIIFVLRVWGSA